MTIWKMITNNDDDKLWPEEEQRIQDIESGKIKTITQTADEFLKELDELINEKKKDFEFGKPFTLFDEGYLRALKDLKGKYDDD